MLLPKKRTVVTPEEKNSTKCRIEHYDDFCKNHDYHVCEKISDGIYIPRKSYKCQDGVVYKTKEEFRRGTGWCPYYIKDGICYGLYEVAKIEQYLYPYDDEVKFIQDRGYERYSIIDGGYYDNYYENYQKEKTYYEQHGFLPRWRKDGKLFSTEQILENDGYAYPYQKGT